MQQAFQTREQLEGLINYLQSSPTDGLLVHYKPKYNENKIFSPGIT
jgi:hypothetical protein